MDSREDISQDWRSEFCMEKMRGSDLGWDMGMSKIVEGEYGRIMKNEGYIIAKRKKYQGN